MMAVQHYPLMDLRVRVAGPLKAETMLLAAEQRAAPGDRRLEVPVPRIDRIHSNCRMWVPADCPEPERPTMLLLPPAAAPMDRLMPALMLHPMIAAAVRLNLLCLLMVLPDFPRS